MTPLGPVRRRRFGQAGRVRFSSFSPRFRDYVGIGISSKQGGLAMPTTRQRRSLITYGTALLLILVAVPSLAAAFEGFGAQTPGGNGGAVIEVTSLADSGPGTLRAALQVTGHAQIVFRIGGSIFLQSSLQVRNRSYITIDGSSAPPPGITLEGYGLVIRTSHDIVVTHLRVRDSHADGILVWDRSRNVVIDHVSVTNSTDENVSITEDTHDVTISWCLIGDTRSNWFALKTKGSLIANFNKPPATNISLHHNVYVNMFQRSPQVSTAGLLDIRNNVIHNWGSYGMRIRQGTRGNIVENVFRSSAKPQSAVILDSDAGPVHISGNQGPGSVDVNRLSTEDEPFAVAPVTTDPAETVESRVLGRAGALPRDAIDIGLVGPSS
jgi:pectate lyase